MDFLKAIMDWFRNIEFSNTTGNATIWIDGLINQVKEGVKTNDKIAIFLLILVITNLILLFLPKKRKKDK